MNSQSPFAPLQELQEERNEGWMTERKPLAPTPRTDAATERINAAHFRGMIVAPIFAATLERELAEKDAKIAEQASQIVALREQLGSFVAQYGCSCGHPACRDCWRTNDAKEALSTPAPPCVLMEDVTPLLDALKIIAANPGASHGPSCLYDSGPIATGAIAKFTAKHPQP